MSLAAVIAFTHIRARLRQTALAILGVATGVGFSVAMAALMQGSQADFINRIVDASPHVVVRDDHRFPDPQPVERVYASGAVALQGQKPKTELRGIRNPKPRLALLEDLPGVAAAPTLRGQVVMRYGGKDVAVSLVGIDPRREVRVSQLAGDMRDGAIDDLYTAANGVLLGDGLARKLAATLGSSVTVTSPTGTVIRAKVVGLFHAGMVSVDEATAYALIKDVQVLLDRPNVINEIRLKLDDPEQARAMAAKVEALIGYRTESWQEASESVMQVFKIRNIIMYTVVAAILVVAGFGIFNIVLTIVFEKTRDIAILKSIGFRESEIRAVFVLEGLVIGLIGTLAGWALGYGLCRLLATVELQFHGTTDITHLPIIYDWRHYAIAGAAAMVSAVIAGYLPARRAARVDPVAIIRGAT